LKQKHQTSLYPVISAVGPENFFDMFAFLDDNVSLQLDINIPKIIVTNLWVY